jgi:hypothetical protein
MRAWPIVALSIATQVLISIPGLAQQSAEQERVQALIDFARRNGQRKAIGIRACEGLGLKPTGDCEVVQVLHVDPALLRGKEPAGTRHVLNVLDEPGTARPWIIVAKELEGGSALMSLMDQNGAFRSALRRTNEAGNWSPFSLELDPAVMTLLGEAAYWLKQAKDAPK